MYTFVSMSIEATVLFERKKDFPSIILKTLLESNMGKKYSPFVTTLLLDLAAVTRRALPSSS